MIKSVRQFFCRQRSRVCICTDSGGSRGNYEKTVQHDIIKSTLILSVCKTELQSKKHSAYVIDIWASICMKETVLPRLNVFMEYKGIYYYDETDKGRAA